MSSDAALSSPDHEIIHASTVAHNGRAVLIRGASGRGKSSLALQLIGLGALLIADDRTVLRGDANGGILASAPDSIKGRIEARFVGIIDAPLADPCPVGLVVDLDQTETDRLPPLRHTCVMGCALPLLFGTDVPHFPASILLKLGYGRT